MYELDYTTVYAMGFRDGKLKAQENGKINKDLIKANTNLVDENKILKGEILRLKNINQRAIRLIERYKKYNVIPLELYEILLDKEVVE